jgi:hypothetical protein
LNNPAYSHDDFVHALDAYCTSDEVSPATANYRALIWSRVTVAAKRSEPELLLHLAFDKA